MKRPNKFAISSKNFSKTTLSFVCRFETVKMLSFIQFDRDPSVPSHASCVIEICTTNLRQSNKYPIPQGCMTCLGGGVLDQIQNTRREVG